MKKRKTLKAIALSLGLAAMMAPATLDAQINHGLLQNPYKDHDDSRRGMMNQNRDVNGSDLTVNTQDFGQDPSAPMDSGIAILIGAGLGYVALKKKEEQQ